MKINELYKIYKKHPFVSIDTRDITIGSLFFALKGENFNGNKYAKEAIEKGAVYAIVDEEAYQLGEQYILVDDVLTTLQELAKEHRVHLDIPVIGVGGSNGKTTTKELIAAVLKQKYEVFSTKRNFNNHIGVPLSVLAIKPSVEIAVLELGANHEGEIELLCEIADPTHGIITNIGMDHLEGFGSFEGVARANSELYKYLLDNDGKVFVNSKDEHLSRMASRLDQVFTYPAKGDYYYCKLNNNDFYLQIRTEDDLIFDTNLIGSYNFDNIAVALCIGKFFDVDAFDANNAIAAYVPLNNRSQIVRKGNVTIVLDAYNANPSSVESAIESLANMEEGDKGVMLGDMYELGDYSSSEHLRMIELVKSKGFTLGLFCGEKYLQYKETHPSLHFFKNKASLHEWIKNNPQENITLLVKGSRSMAMETVLDFM